MPGLTVAFGSNGSSAVARRGICYTYQEVRCEPLDLQRRLSVPSGFPISKADPDFRASSRCLISSRHMIIASSLAHDGSQSRSGAVHIPIYP